MSAIDPDALPYRGHSTNCPTASASEHCDALEALDSAGRTCPSASAPSWPPRSRATATTRSQPNSTSAGARSTASSSARERRYARRGRGSDRCPLRRTERLARHCERLGHPGLSHLKGNPLSQPIGHWATGRQAPRAAHGLGVPCSAKPGHGYRGGVRLLHVCSVPRCPGSSSPGRTRCPEHARGSDRRSRAYRQTRELVLERDRRLLPGRGPGRQRDQCDGRLECHHIRPVEFGGTGDPENMVAVSLRHNNMARRAKPPRWARDLELLGPPAFRPRAARTTRGARRRPAPSASERRTSRSEPTHCRLCCCYLLLWTGMPMQE